MHQNHDGLLLAWLSTCIAHDMVIARSQGDSSESYWCICTMCTGSQLQQQSHHDDQSTCRSCIEAAAAAAHHTTGYGATWFSNTTCVAVQPGTTQIRVCISVCGLSLVRATARTCCCTYTFGRQDNTRRTQHQASSCQGCLLTSNCTPSRRSHWCLLLSMRDRSGIGGVAGRCTTTAGCAQC